MMLLTPNNSYFPITLTNHYLENLSPSPQQKVHTDRLGQHDPIRLPAQCKLAAKMLQKVAVFRWNAVSGNAPDAKVGLLFWPQFVAWLNHPTFQLNFQHHRLTADSSYYSPSSAVTGIFWSSFGMSSKVSVRSGRFSLLCHNFSTLPIFLFLFLSTPSVCPVGLILVILFFCIIWYEGEGVIV